MSNNSNTVDLTRLGGANYRPKVSITPDTMSKKMNGIPSFLGVVPFKLGNDTLNCCYFKDAVANKGDYYFDLGMLMLPKEFRYVDFDVNSKREISNIKIRAERDTNLFTPILLNMNDVEKDDSFFHHCVNTAQDGSTQEKWTKEGCVPDNLLKITRNPAGFLKEGTNPYKDDKPVVLFYYEGDKDFRTAATLDRNGNLKELVGGEVFKYYLMLLQMSEKNFVYYAINATDAAAALAELNKWLDEKYSQNILGIGIDDRLCYNDELMVFITSKAHLVY
jgi:hypothetical protein